MNIKQSEIDFIESIFQDQDFYHSTDIPFSWHYVDNGLMDINTNLHLRASMMYSNFGFFMETIREATNEHHLLYNNVVNGPDQCFFHRQRRYMIQQYLDNDGEFEGPIHISIKPKNDNLTNDDLFSTDTKSIWNNFKIVTHPGHTRLESAAYLQSPIKNAIVTIKKEYDYGGFLARFKRITNPKDIKHFWKLPTHKTLYEKLGFDETGNPSNKLLPPKSELEYNMVFKMERHNLPRGNKYHESTECVVLKLWSLNASYLGFRLGDILNTPVKKYNMAKNNNYLHEVWESSKDISKVVMEKNLCVYTNSDLDVKEYLLKHRRELWRYVVKIKTIFNRKVKKTGIQEPGPDDYVPKSVSGFEFDVVVVDKKPKNISELNDNKGFAIWIDKSRVTDIKREIYELLFFARHDIKKAKTSDEKIEVINCNTKESKEWIIPEEYFK